MMIDRIEGNAELKKSVRMMLDSRRMTHSLLLVGEEGLGAGFAARCVAADYLYPAGGAPAEALLRGECCRAVGKPGDRDSGRVETGIVREAISITGMGSGGRYLVSQVKAMRTEIFNTSLSAEGRAVLLYHVERMNEESANALLKVMEEPPEGVLFIMTADSLAGVLPTIRSRCISFAVAPVSPEACARYCTARGVEKKDAALYSELFDGHIGTVLAAARDEDRRALVEQALTLAKAAQARDSYAAAVLLAGYEKDKAGATALLADFRAAAAAGVQGSKHSPVQGETARKALGLADTAIWHAGKPQDHAVGAGRKVPDALKNQKSCRVFLRQLLLYQRNYLLRVLRRRLRFSEPPPMTMVAKLRTAKMRMRAARSSSVVLRSVRKSEIYS